MSDIRTMRSIAARRVPPGSDRLRHFPLFIRNRRRIMMQWPDWFSHTDRYWLVCALNEHAYKGEPASIDALVGAVLERLPSHLSTRPERPEVIAVVEQTAHLLFEQESHGTIKRRHHDRGSAQQSSRPDKRLSPAAG